MLQLGVFAMCDLVAFATTAIVTIAGVISGAVHDQVHAEVPGELG